MLGNSRSVTPPRFSVKGFLYNLGMKAAPAVLKTRWVYRALTGTESERIHAEYTMGCSLVSSYLQEATLDADAEAIEWLRTLTDQLCLTLVNQERKFQIRCLAGSEANAFAMPGGFLFVSRALLDLCAFDRDEAAFVLAHEMAHVVKSHSLNRLLASRTVQLLSRGAPVQAALHPLVGQLIQQLVTQGYSRRQEFEADAVALKITHVAGFDPGASLRLFARLQKQAKEPGFLAGYFSSHPSFLDRTEAIRRMLPKQD